MIFLLAFSCAAFAAPSLITIENKCEYDLGHIGLAKSGGKFDFDVLEAPLAPNKSVTVEIKDPLRMLDMLVWDTQGNWVVHKNLSMYNIGRILIYGDGSIEMEEASWD